MFFHCNIANRLWLNTPLFSVGWKIGAWFPDRFYARKTMWGRFGFQWVARHS